MNDPQQLSPEELEAERQRFQKIIDEPAPAGANSRVWRHFKQQARSHLAHLNRGHLPPGIEDDEIPF